MPHKYTVEDYLDMKKNKIMTFILGACVQENRKELRQYEVPSLEMHGDAHYQVCRATGEHSKKKESCGQLVLSLLLLIKYLVNTKSNTTYWANTQSSKIPD